MLSITLCGCCGKTKNHLLGLYFPFVTCTPRKSPLLLALVTLCKITSSCCCCIPSVCSLSLLVCICLSFPCFVCCARFPGGLGTWKVESLAVKISKATMVVRISRFFEIVCSSLLPSSPGSKDLLSVYYLFWIMYPLLASRRCSCK